jgi:hypothetical protein
MLQVVLLFAVIINSDGRAQPRCSCGCLAGTRLVSSQERGHCMRTVSRFATHRKTIISSMNDIPPSSKNHNSDHYSYDRSLV